MIFYYMFLSIFGYKKAKRNYKIHKPKLKFLILIPSHNEENVIGVTIENLQQIDYPKDLYQIVVVSDQSTDATTAIANAEGVKVIDTSLGAHPRIGVGKSGQYEVHLTTADGQDKTITLTVLDNKKSISGEDFTMTVGDKQSTAGDFKAVATMKMVSHLK
ncbi:glycosyltransferase [Lentilactobacillus kosonis]|uniref:N-acetylglucosaminyltransferase n=1 Tax=Lentilactobacillus kosonis TaxID=2810561 RepID=A0A401FI36_9LACO|nr:glycosyltransferase [Lentilactobacillus kosonis]GAY72024.1 N-acetylglucosaminyltransferase [Lentilactobacillus kosonis]